MLASAVQAVSQIVALASFLAAGLEHAHTSKQLVEQVFEFFFCIALTAFHRALGISAFFGGRNTLFAQCGASSI